MYFVIVIYFCVFFYRYRLRFNIFTNIKFRQFKANNLYSFKTTLEYVSVRPKVSIFKCWFRQSNLYINEGDPNYGKGFWKLNKALYGLRQSGRQWYKTITNFITNNGFKQLKSEPCMFFKIFNNKVTCLIGIYWYKTNMRSNIFVYLIIIIKY